MFRKKNLFYHYFQVSAEEKLSRITELVVIHPQVHHTKRLYT